MVFLAVILALILGPVLIAVLVMRAYWRSSRRDDLWPLNALVAAASGFAFWKCINPGAGLMVVPVGLCFGAAAYATARTAPWLRRGRPAVGAAQAPGSRCD